MRVRLAGSVTPGNLEQLKNARVPRLVTSAPITACVRAAQPEKA